MSDLLLRLGNVSVSFEVKNEKALPWAAPHTIKAVDDVSFDLKPGETLGVVGESGCGKSTLARSIAQLVPSTGSIKWDGTTELNGLSKREMIPYRAQIQTVFQDPVGSLNPRLTIGQIIEEPLTAHQPNLSRSERRLKVQQMMERVSLLPNQINRYPHEFSGGQCQRVGIARALIVKPRLLICDEPVSALDVSVQAQIINLLQSIKQEMNLAMLFISHDLSVVRHIADRVMVLYMGRVMEMGKTSDLYGQPHHPYTQALISAAPIPDPVIERSKERLLLQGDLPSSMDPPSGCVFRTRCQKAEEQCRLERPVVKASGNDRMVACFLAKLIGQ